MAEPRLGTQEQWQVEREELLKEEKELTRRSDELARKRRELPWVPVENAYRFATGNGTKTLAELFDGRTQLLVYHFMFGPSWEAGCPVCSSIADTLDPQVSHLRARDTTLVLASRAPLEKLLGYKERMGWRIEWVSSGPTDLNRDLGFLYTPPAASSRRWPPTACWTAPRRVAARALRSRCGSAAMTSTSHASSPGAQA